MYIYYVSDQFARGFEVRIVPPKPFYLTADERRWREEEGNLTDLFVLNCEQSTRKENTTLPNGRISEHTEPSSMHTYLKVNLAEFIGSGCQVNP